MHFTKYSGWYLFATGVIHNLLGVLLGWSVIAGVHADGWFNTVEPGGVLNFERSAILWFLALGATWMMMGHLMQVCLREKVILPRSLGISLLLMGLIVAFVLPASGAWLFLPQGILIIVGSSKES